VSDADDEAERPRPDGVPPGAILRVLPVPGESAGQRLDVFVQSKLKRTSRTRAARIIEQSAFDVRGNRLRPSSRVREGESVLLWREPFEDEDAELPELRIVHEDLHLLVIDKPPLCAVHPTARYHKHTVIKRLKADRPRQFLALIHRLDRETSGVLMLAKDAETERTFKRLLEQRTKGVAEADPVKKTYLAITRGVPPEGLIDLPLALDLENSLRVKMKVSNPGEGLASRTGISVLAVRGGYALVRCELHTGRQHQIRLHLSAVGCPVVGDKLYGSDERMLSRAADGELDEADLIALELPRHALHAHRYELLHPVLGTPLDLVVPLPADLETFWESRGEREHPPAKE
jgi:23S rRNA pseudouridine1911/1915/1917 synthase